MILDTLRPYKWLLQALLLAAAAAAVVWAVHTYNAHQQAIGAARVQAEWDRSKAQALAAQRERENLLQKGVNDAQTQAQTARQTAAAAAGTAAAAGRVLDSTLQARAAALAGDPGSALAQYATTLGAVLSECQAAYRGMAATADGHAADSLMYQRAWPRNDAK